MAIANTQPFKGTNDLIPTTAISVYDPQKDEWKTLETRTPFEKSHVNCAYDDRYIYMVAGKDFIELELLEYERFLSFT